MVTLKVGVACGWGESGDDLFVVVVVSNQWPVTRQQQQQPAADPGLSVTDKKTSFAGEQDKVF